MKNFVKALYADLLHRIDLVIDEIDRMDHHEDYRTRFIESTLQKIYEIRKPIQQALEIGGLEYDTLAGNYLFQYNRLNREFNAYHSYRFLAIKNYGKPEQFFYRLITKLYKEHRITSLPPIVSTISNHDYYYWAVPMLEIIAIPSGEENSLLNLPDMYHEIGHLLYSMYKGRSCELSGIAIDKHFKKEIASLHDKRQYEHFGAVVSRARDLWQASWLEEFSCDLAGTYMTGAAYAWTNLKLISADHGSSKIFDYNDTHPANEARMRIIIMMLDKLGLTEEKKSIEETWQVFLHDAEIFRPPAYKLIFPDKLLSLIINEFFNFYDNADLANCTELHGAEQKSIAQLLNEAWEQAQTAPSEFNVYETASISQLYAEFGIER
jgi:hypothetical protein